MVHYSNLDAKDVESLSLTTTPSSSTDAAPPVLSTRNAGRLRLAIIILAAMAVGAGLGLVLGLGLGRSQKKHEDESSSSSAPVMPPKSSSTSSRAPAASHAGAANRTYQVEVGPYEAAAEETAAYRRSDVAETQAGFPTTYTITALDSSGAPMAGVRLDYWAANAQGLYSDEAAEGTSGTDYLRGYQVTDSDGVAQFTSIFSGPYHGRTNHVHLRVRTYGGGGSGSNATYDGTTQLFFPAAATEEVMATSTYARSNADSKSTTNSDDRLYQAANEMSLSGSVAEGAFAATYRLRLPLTSA